ncbi:hypothetical protein V4F39_06960 [Aquincola sp. MAHUQ-54]|uniref:Type II secretion system (T2SS) protein M subtype b n=1 Tax=Aquincola agrisoli TaxID=3119538 RepID=A0AAW9Q1D1_9BURK
MQSKAVVRLLRGRGWPGRFVGVLKAAPLLVAAAAAVLVMGLCALWRSEEVRALARAAREGEAERAAARTQLPSVPKDDRDFSSAFEVPISLNDLTAEAGKVAERHGVALVSVDVKQQETTAGNELAASRLALVMSGTYPALKATLSELWLAHGHWQIRNLSMRQTAGSDRVELQLQIAVFRKTASEGRVR